MTSTLFSARGSGWTVYEEVARLKAKLNAARASSSSIPQPANAQIPDQEIYNPGSIASTGIPVTADTPLAIGDILQVQWRGTTWWAAEVAGLEDDGWVGIRYVGWLKFPRFDGHDWTGLT